MWRAKLNESQSAYAANEVACGTTYKERIEQKGEKDASEKRSNVKTFPQRSSISKNRYIGARARSQIP